MFTNDKTPEAKRLAGCLKDVANELRIRGRAAANPNASELANLDAQSCEDAAALLQVYDTEIERLRQGIGCFHYGRLEGAALTKMCKTWNGEQ